MELHKTKAIKVFLIFILSFVFIGCDNSFNALNTTQKISFNYDPKSKSLSCFNEPFLIFFYSSTCGYCKEQANYLNQLDTSFKMIAVIGDKTKKEEAIKHTHGLNIPIIYDYGGVDFLSNAVGGISGVPVMVFYDENGRMVKRYNGLVSLTRIKEQIFSIQNKLY